MLHDLQIFISKVSLKTLIVLKFSLFSTSIKFFGIMPGSENDTQNIPMKVRPIHIAKKSVLKIFIQRSLNFHVEKAKVGAESIKMIKMRGIKEVRCGGFTHSPFNKILKFPTHCFK